MSSNAMKLNELNHGEMPEDPKSQFKWDHMNTKRYNRKWNCQTRRNNTDFNYSRTNYGTFITMTT